MSELKVYHCNEWHNEYTEFYIKSEADKVIADLEESHKKEVEQLLIEIAELEEERRWRKFPDEKPEHNGIYIVLLGEHTRTLDAYDTDKGKFRTYMPTAWLPLPSAPKEENEYVIEHTADVINGQEREIRHQKYKRCLAMARRCFTKSNYHFVLARHGEDAKENNRRSILYSKWRNRWLKIAEKFKEAK